MSSAEPQTSQVTFAPKLVSRGNAPSSVHPAQAAMRVGFVPYAGEGYALLLPSKWNPSKEREAAGIQLR